MKRKLSTTLPSCLKQKKHPKLEQKLNQQKMMQKAFYDRTAKQLLALSRNDPVRIANPEGWMTRAAVLQEVAPQSYTVRTKEGQINRRNRRSLLKTPGTVADQELSETQTEYKPNSTSPENCNTDTYTKSQTNTLTPREIATRKSARTSGVTSQHQAPMQDYQGRPPYYST